MKKLLTVEQVADFLNVSPRWLYEARYHRSGPPAMKVGKFLRYDEDQLRAWLAAGADRASA